MTEEVARDDESLSLASQAVRILLERQGIPKHRHAAFVGEFFGLSRAAAHQRVNRSAAWTLEELKTLAERFGENLADVVMSRGPNDARPAIIRIGGFQSACRVWVDRSRAPAATDGLVAREDDAGLMVVAATAVTVHGGIRVARIEIEQSIMKPARVAVIDDEEDVASALCDQLRNFGLAAESFDDADVLTKEMAQMPYDGYVVDWLLRKGDASALLAAIRGQTKPSAVVLLSGKLRSGSADPADVASACTAFRVQLIEKPAQVPLVISALELAGLRLDKASA